MQTESSLTMFQTLKAALVAAACALVLAVGFALVLKISSFSDKVILPVNLCIKAVSIFVGCLCSLRGEKGWLKGGAAALGFTALSYLAFSALGGDFSLSWLIFAELLWTAGAGVLSGMIAVNLRR